MTLTALRFFFNLPSVFAKVFFGVRKPWFVTDSRTGAMSWIDLCFGLEFCKLSERGPHQVGLPSREGNVANGVFEESVAADQDMLFWVVETDAARGMAGGMDDIEVEVAEGDGVAIIEKSIGIRWGDFNPARDIV